MIFIVFGFFLVQDLKRIKRNAQGGHWSSSNNVSGLDNTEQSEMRTLKNKKTKKDVNVKKKKKNQAPLNKPGKENQNPNANDKVVR